MLNNTASSGPLSADRLDQLGESTGDCYFCYDYGTEVMTFSDNARDMFAALGDGRARCTIYEWLDCVYATDRPHLEGINAEMRSMPGQVYSLNYRTRNRNGQHVWVNSRGKSYPDDSGDSAYVLGRVSVQYDEAYGAQADMLPRVFHRNELKSRLARMRRSGEDGCLLMADVDNLKQINMRSGWDFGDLVIRTLAHGMTRTLPGARQVYRINSDRFAAVLTGIGTSQVEQAFDELRAYMRDKCTISGGCVSLTQYKVPGEDALIQYAEIAIEAAKAAGKNRLSFFSPEDYEKRLKAMELRDEMKAAVEAGFEGFDIAYQAQVRSESYELFGAEALLRFNSPRRGAVPPTEFVRVLEESELIHEVGLWVLRSALSQCRMWRTVLPEFHISINMSYVQLSSPDIEANVLRAVRESGVPGSALTIELTESMELLNYPHLNDIIRAWKREGIEISVDDFGTGYSNLRRLHEMDIDEIKIDRCFVSGIQSSAYNYRLVSNMVELADSCQMRICCEGVETAEELSALETLRPTMYQGFFFARPELAEAFSMRAFDWRDMVRRSGVGELMRDEAMTEPMDSATEELICAKAILDAEDDIYYLSDMSTYELRYLNRAGQKLFGVRDFKGRKCYKVLHGLDAPCEFCTNGRIRRNTFYVWEHQNDYCARRFLLKDKLVLCNGRPARFEVAVDITKHERVSQATSERLEFAGKIVSYLQTLSTQADYGAAVNRVLESVGGYYQADRAYLFERNRERADHWDNTYEWCANSVQSERMNLQEVPPEVLERWLEIFNRNESVMIYNLDPVRAVSPLEWSALEAQGIYRLIAVPLMEDGHVRGFLGVDNPRYSIHDDSQMRVLASFLVSRMRQDDENSRRRALLMAGNADVCSALDMGFWSMSMCSAGGAAMTGDCTLRRMLNMEDGPDDADCLAALRAHVCAEDRARFDAALERMARPGRAVSASFKWRNPGQGELVMDMSGVRMSAPDADTLVKGYCRWQRRAV